MTLAASALLFCLIAPPQATEEDSVRAAVQQYYDAQAARDPDKAASFWSPTANPRITRDTFLALFGPAAEDTYTVEIRSVTVNGADARVRVMWVLTRVETRDGHPFGTRKSGLNSQTWHKTNDGWKLLRDAPFASELADEYLGLAATDRAAYLARQTPADLGGLRYEVAQRATMAVTLRRDYVGGRTLFERALEIARAAGDHVSEASALHNVGQADYLLRDFAGATDSFEKELAVAREHNDDSDAGGALYSLGTVAYAGGEYSTALGHYRDALVIYDKRDDGPSSSRALISIGNIQYLQADYDAATASYKRAETLSIAGGDPPGATLARGALARVLAAQGDFASALDIYGGVLADARAAAVSDPRLGNAVATTLDSIGEIHFRLGNLDQARASFDEGRKLVDTDLDLSGRFYTELGLTELLAGKFDVAFADYSEALKRSQAAKEPAAAARAWIGIGFSQAGREKFPEAIAAYRTAIRMFEEQRHDDESARAWLGLSIAQIGAKDYAGSLDSARKVTTIAAVTKSDDLAWRGAVRVGEAQRKLQRLDEARQAFQSAIETIGRIARDAPIDPEARTSLDDSGSAWAGLALTLAGQGDAPGALNAIEGERALVRRVNLSAFHRDITRGETGDERTAERDLARDIVSTRAQLHAEQSAPHPDAAKADRLSKDLAALLAKRIDQQSALYSRLPELQQWRALTEPDADVVSTLVSDAHTALVDYLVTDKEILVVSAARGDSGLTWTSAIIDTAGRRELGEQIAKAMDAAVLTDPEQWSNAARPIAAALLKPVSAAIADRNRIVIVPDEFLWKIPFEALPFGGADLASQAQVTYATSLATLALERKLVAPGDGAPADAAAASPPHVAATIFAAPALSDAVRAQVAVTQPGWKAPDAEKSAARAAEIAKLYGDAAVVRTGGDATEASLREQSQTADILQISAPFQASGPTPLFTSFLLVGTGDAAAADGRWEAREWFASAGHARVLVADDGSTLGAAGVGSGMDTIAWAAASAGIASLVTARWPADAFAVDALELSLHAVLARGGTIDDAWASAVKAAREQSTAPSGWTGLRLIGGS